MKLELFIDGVRSDVFMVDLTMIKMYDQSNYLNNSIQNFKFRNRALINAAKEWQIFMTHKSKNPGVETPGLK